MPLYGHELSEEIDPFQAGLSWAVKMDKGDFIGREALAATSCGCERCRVVSAWSWQGRRAAREGSAVLLRGLTDWPRHQRHLYADPEQGHCNGLRRSGIHGRRAPPVRGRARQERRGARGAAAVLSAKTERARRASARFATGATRPARQLRKEDRMDPKTLRYAKTHEWAYLEGDVCTIGLTKFAVDQLTDIIYIDMPDVDDPVSAGDSFGEIESVKAVSDIILRLPATSRAINEKLETDPTLISNDPYDKGWLIKVKVEKGTTLDHLMTLEQYRADRVGRALSEARGEAGHESRSQTTPGHAGAAQRFVLWNSAGTPTRKLSRR